MYTKTRSLPSYYKPPTPRRVRFSEPDEENDSPQNASVPKIASPSAVPALSTSLLGSPEDEVLIASSQPVEAET